MNYTNNDVETHVVTYKNRSASELMNTMNLQGRVIVSNQNGKYSKREEVYDRGQVTFFELDSVGIGRNRNNLLINASSNLIVLADDDVIFKEDYLSIVTDAYNKLPDADMIIFNIDNIDVHRSMKISKIRWYNYMRYGATRITFKLESVAKDNVLFSTQFGGSKYGAGEDTIFLRDCLKRKMNIYSYPESLAALTNNRPSTWDNGFTEKYFNDRGAALTEIGGVYHKALILVYAVKLSRNKSIEYKFSEIFKMMRHGSKNYKEQ